MRAVNEHLNGGIYCSFFNRCNTLFMNRTYLLLILGLALFSCGNRTGFKERKVIEVQLKVIKHFEYKEGKIIRMTADDNGIYILSSPDNVIRVFDYNGKLRRTIGKNGEAPSDNGLILSYGYDSTSYWVHDVSKEALKKYDIKKDTMMLFRRYQTRNNVLFLCNNQCILPQFKSETGILYLELYDALKDSIIKSIDICSLVGRTKKLPPRGELTFEGQFCKNEQGQAVFYCISNSSFFFIDRDFKVSHHSDVRNFPISEPVVKEYSPIRLIPQNIGILSGTMDNEYIYFLAPKYHERKSKYLKSYMIDVYDINTKKYLISFDLPNPKEKYVLNISKSNKGFVVSYRGGDVVVYNNDFIKEIQKTINRK
jgi:hypothetical protein